VHSTRIQARRIAHHIKTGPAQRTPHQYRHCIMHTTSHNTTHTTSIQAKRSAPFFKEGTAQRTAHQYRQSTAHPTSMHRVDHINTGPVYIYKTMASVHHHITGSWHQHITTVHDHGISTSPQFKTMVSVHHHGTRPLSLSTRVGAGPRPRGVSRPPCSRAMKLLAGTMPCS
jgi:hypothetical protein